MKKAIVVGATSGIGREVAVRLADKGWMVGITGRRAELLHELRMLRPQSFNVLAFDAAAADSTNKLASLIGGLGGMDLLVFCSGTGDMNPELDYRIEYVTNQLNVDAFTHIVDFTYNYFRKQGGGHIAAVTSVMGLRGSGAAPSYAASKAYQISYLEGLRQRSRKNGDNVAVTELRPGSVRTAMMKGEGHFWISTPQRAADTIVAAIENKKRVKYVTSRWQVVGTLLKIIPRCLYEKL